MKEVYDELEHSLMFPDLNDIDRTENHDRKNASKSKSRKIRYLRNVDEPVTQEERDRDSKSTRSGQSKRSRESIKSQRSVRSSRSNESGEKAGRSNGRKSKAPEDSA